VAKTLNKLKWNKSSLIETDLYIKLYIAALNQFLSAQEKQTLFMISKFFTDGAAEVGRNRTALAEYYFKIGESYYEIAESNALLKQVIANVYDRSKSFYYYKTGNTAKAIDLINHTLINNRLLEEKGFKFLVFDRIQQYHNLSRIYFSVGKINDGFKLLTGITCFLVQGSCDLIPELNENFIAEYDDDLCKTKFYMLSQILFETTEHLLSIKDAEEFLITSTQYFSGIFVAANNYLVLVPEDKLLKEWILILSDFYQKKIKRFKLQANEFIHKKPPFYNGLPHKYLNYCLNLVPQ
jgi:hypothetical protein